MRRFSMARHQPVPYTLWLLLGAVLLFAELVVPAFVCGAFAIAAFLIAALTPLGLRTLDYQLVVFALSSPAIIFAARTISRRRFWRSVNSNVDAIPGEIALVIQPIVGPAAKGRVSLFGIDWLARTESSLTIPVDVRVRVEKVEGITLIVSPISEDTKR
jgi:membrane protein implicated in regulation of membrane protease activity